MEPSSAVSCLTLEATHSVTLPHLLQGGGGGTFPWKFSVPRVNVVHGRYTGMVEGVVGACVVTWGLTVTSVATVSFSGSGSDDTVSLCLRNFCLLLAFLLNVEGDGFFFACL